ncbi:hypothetical protein PHMEG_00025265 [Phytophthora megakarya]|uniref:DDE Tnp4 domain-containing protein n=1 Tax=Phytophthora megakarya TaxID=4795 RepID=A0A225VD78_9STRA|nr:hypothetical protein PHMEG_00025265 [Phytophthora megakarya]
MYNCRKSTHPLKFQPIVTPDGLISHLCSPNESCLNGELEGNLPLHVKLIYGGPAYGCTNVFCCPYKGYRVHATLKELNQSMRATRVSVEWSYGWIAKYFSCLDYKRHQRVVTTYTEKCFTS